MPPGQRPSLRRVPPPAAPDRGPDGRQGVGVSSTTTYLGGTVGPPGASGERLSGAAIPAGCDRMSQAAPPPPTVRPYPGSHNVCTTEARWDLKARPRRRCRGLRRREALSHGTRPPLVTRVSRPSGVRTVTLAHHGNADGIGRVTPGLLSTLRPRAGPNLWGREKTNEH